MLTQKTVIANDLHIRFEDKISVKLLIEFIKREKPNAIALNGDIGDFYQVSCFDRDPRRIESLQDELDLVNKFLKSVRKAAPDAKIDYIEGNHEDRLRRFLWKRGKELTSLRCLDLWKLLGLKELGIKYHKDGLSIGGLYVTHGSIIRKHAGYTARAEFEKNGCTGMSGHTHRDGKYTVRNRSGHFAWWENFCLCELDPEYITGIANWTQGFSVVTTVKKRPYVEQIPIISHKYIYGGKMYG